MVASDWDEAWNAVVDFGPLGDALCDAVGHAETNGAQERNDDAQEEEVHAWGPGGVVKGHRSELLQISGTVITVANRIGGEDDVFIGEANGMRGWTRAGVLILVNGERVISVWGEVSLEKDDRVDVDMEVRA